MITCPGCNGNGDIYSHIGEYEHISICETCKGAGLIMKVEPEPKESRGSVNLDSLFAEESLSAEAFGDEEP